MERRSGGREGARASCSADRSFCERNRLHFGRHGVQQHRSEGSRPVLQGKEKPRHHDPNGTFALSSLSILGAQVRLRQLPLALRAGLRSDLPPCAEERSHQPGRLRKRDHRQDQSRLHHGRQQRNRRGPAAQRDRRHLPQARRPLPHRLRPDVRQGGFSVSPFP